MTFDQVRHDLDIPRLEALNRYWEYSPPAHIMIAKYFGIEKPKKKSEEETAKELMAAFPLGGF